MTSLVSLVGSGPGDPGLLTLKALKRLREADLIIYDYLANPAHLQHAHENAVKICVGKGFRHHPFSQRKINSLILAAARKGQKVVRLKGGDPYLFGRGGEEALYLYKHKISFEVVPGVTSATACAAYSGIPLTHREHNSSVTFLTGHKAHDEHLDAILWDKIVSIGGTLVIYMGFYNLKKICERLIHAGLLSATPVSVIEWGTLPRQKSCFGDLTSITRKVEERKLKAPAMIIVGDVVRLSRKLNWFERLPFFGKTILVTRMREKAGILREHLEELGADIIEFPVIEIKPLINFKKIDVVIKNLRRTGPAAGWFIFASAHGVEAFFERLKYHKKDVRMLKNIKIASVGPETSKTLNGYGVIPDLEPKRFETKALVDEFKKRIKVWKDLEILLMRTDIAPTALEEGLKKLGAKVTRLTVYRTRLPKKVAPVLRAAILKREIHMVTFTSSSTVKNFVKIIGLANVKRMAKTAKFASIGPVTSKTLRRHGFKPACEAKVFTVHGLVEAMKKSL